MTERSDHLTLYGLVGVALHLVVGFLVGASFTVVPTGWMVVLIALWLASTALGVALWKRTVWVPLLASIFVSAIWMIAFLGSR